MVVDEQLTDDSVDARGVLANWLDDYTAGRCDRAQMQASFLQICRDNPEAPWDALALLDQYQRRGRVDAALARSLKSDIAQLVFGAASQTDDSGTDDGAGEGVAKQGPDTVTVSQAAAAGVDTDQPSGQKTGVDTGTRWRRLAAERGSTAAAGSFDPLTRLPVTRDLGQPPPVREPAHSASAKSSQRREAGGPNILRQRYELLTILGRGRSGTVYQALDRHRSHLDPSEQCVALRVLKHDYATHPDALNDLMRQFHQAQSLSHPNLVSMFDLDRDGDTYFMVMELLQGELLSEVLQRLDRRPMARQRALSVIGSIGAALAHAHRRNLVHGDLKPGKVMLTTAGEVKVLDFGFGRQPPAEAQRGEPWIGVATDGPDATGNSAYASAEQVHGEAPHPGDDVYSLACIAYELLSGQHPYGGRSGPLARAQGRVPQRIAKLSKRQWQTLRTALQWSRQDRTVDVVELISGLGCAEVEQQLALPKELRPDTGTGRAGRAWLLGLLVLLGLGAAVWYQQWPLPKLALKTPPSEAVLPASPEASADDTNQVHPAAAQPGETHSEPAIRPRDEAKSSVSPAQDTNSRQPAQAAAPAAKELPQSQPNATSQAAPKATPDVPSAAAPAAAPPTATPAVAGPTVISFDKDTYVATEGDGAVKLTVKRTGNLRKPAVFHWKVLPNSAQEGSDYVDLGPGTETMPAGTSTAALVIPLVNDSVKENTELFLVELSLEDDAASLGPVSRAAVIIVDDD